jgi:hypothetical protein
MTLTKEDVLEKILVGRPVSVVRCGDGEKLILDCLSSTSAFRVASESVFRRQTGYDPTLKELEEIRENLISAYSSCDVLGVPMQKNLSKLSSHWTKVVEVLNENVPKHTEVYCSIDVAYEWLADGSYDRLLQNRKVLNYISCRDLDEGFKRKWNIGCVNQNLIAPESKFVSGYVGDVHYPTQFNRIPRWMDVVSERHPGTLLLVGAGVIGKIYCNWWRDRGGVAMDIGAVADIWAGKVTRGPERGLDKDDPDTKYKL